MKSLVKLFSVLTIVSCGQNTQTVQSDVKNIASPKDGYKASGYIVGRPIKCSYKKNIVLPGIPYNWECEYEKYKVGSTDGVRDTITATSEALAKEFNELAEAGKSVVLDYRRKDDLTPKVAGPYYLVGISKFLGASVAQDLSAEDTSVSSEFGRRGKRSVNEDGRLGHLVEVTRWTRWFFPDTCELVIHEGGLSRDGSGDTTIATQTMNVYSEEACQGLEKLIKVGVKVRVSYTEANFSFADNSHIAHKVTVNNFVTEDGKEELSLEDSELKEALKKLLRDPEIKKLIKQIIDEDEKK